MLDRAPKSISPTARISFSPSTRTDVCLAVILPSSVRSDLKSAVLGLPLRRRFLCSAYLSAPEKFAETLRLDNSIVGEPQLLVLTGELGIGVGFKGVLNNGSTDFVPNFDGMKQPRGALAWLVKFE